MAEFLFSGQTYPALEIQASLEFSEGKEVTCLMPQCW